MILAKKGSFVLCRETFLGNRKLTTHCIELCKILSDGSRYTIAKVNSNGNLQSIDLRLLDEINTIEDLEDAKTLSKILYNIVVSTEDFECQ